MLKQLIIVLLAGLFAFSTGKAQVLNAPHLNCVGIDSPATIILLTWSIPTNTCPFTAYNIYRSTNFNGPYTLIYTETNPSATTYQDAVGPIGALTYYYFMTCDDSNCPGYTIMHSDTIDHLNPAPTYLHFVTVNNNFAELNWKPGSSPETFGYIIYNITSTGGNKEIDTVYGKNDTTYIDYTSGVNDDTVSYRIACIDSCLNASLISNLAHHTIYLQQTTNRCDQIISINWIRYDHWLGGVLQYDVYVSKNGDPPVLVQTLPPYTLSYDVTGFDDGDSLCITVVATEATTLYTSSSNTVCTKFNVVQPANDFYIRNVTVTASNQVDVYYSMDSLADLVNLGIERSTDSVIFNHLAQFVPPGDLSGINIYSDTTALTDQLSYYYRLIAQDSCGGSDTSTSSKTVLLQGYAFTNLSYLLRWDKSYFDFGTVTGYDVYRDDGNGFNNVASFQPDQLEFSESGIPSTEPCYYVDAIDSLIFPNGLIDTIRSRSNIVCLLLPSQIYMPNAFAPAGKNNIFKPILNVDGVTSFDFSIFNRWGEEIFSSEDPDDGWDGTFRGNLVQQGAYVYQVVLVDGNKKRIEAKGSVLVVR